MEDNIQHIHPNASKSGLTISECHKSPSKILNCQRSMPIIVHNINSSNRFVGGADKKSAVEETFATILPESVQNIPNSSPSPPILSTPPSSLVEKSLDESAQLKEDSQNKQLPTSGPCCFCSPQTPGLVGDRKVDEIIEYVHQNLAEAGKALASLGENFEHDLKLMFVNILGRIQQWTGIVQNKLGTCKNEVDNLRKELLARACEIDVKTRELKNIKAGFAKYQNDLLSNGELPKKSLNKKYKLEPNEQREASIREDLLAMEDAQATNAKKIMRATRAADEDEEDAQAEKEIKRIKKINAQKNAARAADQENAEDVQLERAVDQTDEEEDEETRDANRIDEEDEERAIDRIIKTDEDEEESLKRGVKKRKMKDIAYTNMMVQTDVQEERIKRESELESEVKRLRKEYDRVMKERAQYENTIQRALLRGVSSLNVEALRVLRCPPISCCTPCAPCPATTGIIPPEPVVLCPGKIKKKHSKSAIATVNSAKVSRNKNIQNGDQTDCTTKRPSTSICYSVRNQKSNIALMRKKCSDGSMVFLLHQGDARNLNISDKVCGSTIIKKIEIPPLPKFSI